MMFFQCPVATIIVSLVFVRSINLRIGDCSMYCVGNIQYYFRSILGGIFTNVLEYLPHLFLRPLRPNNFVPLLYHFFICFTNSS